MRTTEVNVGIKKKSGKIVAKWIQIKYNYLPKYCRTCKLQGHNEEDCFVLHPELFDDGKKENKENKKEEPTKGGATVNTKIMEEGKTKNNGEESQNDNAGKDENIGRITRKQGIVTMWDPKPNSGKVDTSKNFNNCKKKRVKTRIGV